MSAIAEFVLFPKSKLEKIKRAASPRKIPFLPKDSVDTAINRAARLRVSFDGSGYLFAVLFPFLEEKGINLMNGEHSDIANLLWERQKLTCFTIGYGERMRYEGQLQPEHFTADELTMYWNEFNEDSWEGAGEAMLTALGALHGYTCRLDLETVLLLFLH